MLRRERIVFIAAIVLVITLGVGIAAVIGVQNKREADAARRDREYKELTSELVLRRAELQMEYSNVENKTQASLPQESSAVLVFLDVDEAIYDTMYLEFGIGGKRFPGVMCFSETELPGLEGRITMDEYLAMSADGWSGALYWNGTGELSDFIENMRGSLAALGIEMPDTLVFADGTFRLAYDDILNEKGIFYAVHHGDDGLPLIDSSIRTTVKHPGTVGWNEVKQQKLYHNSLVSSGGVGSYSFSFGDSSLSSYFDPYNGTLVESFTRMLDYLEQYSKTEVKITDFADAWETRIEYTERLEDMKSYVAEKQAEIRAQISEIDRELVKIYDKVYGG